MSPPVAGPDREQTVDVPGHEALPSCGGQWDLPSQESSPPTDSVFDGETAPVTDGTHARKASASPSTSVSDGEGSEQAEDEESPETQEEQGTEERGTSEGETEGSKKPMDRQQWEELVRAVVAADPSLSRVMYPLANRKTALMLMEQLLSEDTLLMEEHYKKKQELQGATQR